MERLLRALRSDADDRLTCGECREQLPGYMLALEQGEGAGALWADVQAHLAVCLPCGELHDELAALGEPELAELAAAAAAPAPDLGFARRAPLVAVQLTSLGEAVISFGQGIVAAVERAFAGPGFAAARSGGGELTEQIPSPLAEHLFDASVTIRRAADPDLCTLVVKVAPAGKAWPDLAGTLVSVRGASHSYEPVETDAHGIARLADVRVADLPGLSIVVELLAE
jgi:hypothetical protein